MSPSARPVSLIAEKALRYLREHGEPVDSITLARELLATRTADESLATRVVESAFAGDSRLAYRGRGWVRASDGPPASAPEPAAHPAEGGEQDRVLLALKGHRPARGQPFLLTQISALRIRGNDVVAACGGEAGARAAAEPLRGSLLATLEGAIPVVHDPPGSLSALEGWLDEPIEHPVSLRRLAQARLDLPASHDFETLMARLGLAWRDAGEPLELADALDACLRALRRPGESLRELQRLSDPELPPLDWSRFAFDRRSLREIPAVPGTYQFFDREGELIYAGKSRNLHRRVGSYFRAAARRSRRVRRLLESLHRIEIEPEGSELEALLHEAELIRTRAPRGNVQRRVRKRAGRASRVNSILILEPAAPPLVLRAYLLREGRLVDKVGIGPRGGGLQRIERLLDDHFFSVPTGPTTVLGPDLDVEIVTRWLAANRDRVVAFDPTNLRCAKEVTGRLRWFLNQGSLFDRDGTPIVTR
jgi:hypothetical protein